MAKVWTSDGPEDERIDVMNPGHAPVHALARTLTFADVSPVVQPGEVLGLQVDEPGAAPAVPLTGLEVGELARFHTRQTFTTAGVGVSLALASEAVNVLEKTSGASVSLSSITGGSTGRVIRYQHRASGGTTTTFEHDTGGTDGFLCPNDENFVCGGNVASGGISLNQVELFYDPNQGRWLVFPRGLTAPELRGVGLHVDPTLGVIETRARLRHYQEWDFFNSGPSGAVSGIGKLNWNLLGNGTPTYTRANAGFTSTTKSTIATSGAANNRASLVLGDAEARQIALLSDVEILQFAFNFNSVLTNKRFAFGFNDNFANEPGAATDALMIYFDSAVSATNLIVVARAANVGVPVVTSFAVSAANSHLFTLYQPTAGTWELHASHTTQADVLLATISTGLPTGGLNIGARLETLTAAPATFRVGAYMCASTLLGGVFNDDNFLEN